MLTRYRLARRAGYSFLVSIAFAVFNRKPRDVQSGWMKVTRES
jgi:hypothetical protein